MRYEGQTFASQVPQVWAQVDADGTIRCPQHTTIMSGLTALRLPAGVQVTRLRLDPELLAQGLDLANNGEQYGDTVYLRSHTGYVIRPEVLGVAAIAPSESVDSARPESRRRKAAEAVPSAA